MLRQQVLSETYWTSEFRMGRSDIDLVFSSFLEDGLPLTTQDIALKVIAYRIKQIEENFRKQLERGTVYQPQKAYKVGQAILFPAFDYALGKVVATRAGKNPDYGKFTVIEVEFEDATHRSLAAALKVPHALNVDEAASPEVHRSDIAPMTIFEQYGEAITEEIEAVLVDQADAVFFDNKWFLSSLMLDVNVGHLHLAEAILDINQGGPLQTSNIIREIEFGTDSSPQLAEFSLDVSMSQDDRFDDVGPIGQVRWFLRRLEPEEIIEFPPRLVYQPFDYDRSVISGEMAAIEIEIDDELSELPTQDPAAKEATLTLIYPHRRVGTLPITSRVAHIFPTAQVSPRICITLVDAQDNAEFTTWVVRDGKFVYGLSDFYRKHRLPIGAYIRVKATEDPSRLIIDFEAYRPRSEYIRLAQPANSKLSFANFKRSIGSGYDELLILGAEDVEGVDQVWGLTRERRKSLVDIMRDLIPELAKLNPQSAVHAKTLYSAVNVLRRCPPGPIFATLISRPEFQHVAGPYWRLAT